MTKETKKDTDDYIPSKLGPESQEDRLYGEVREAVKLHAQSFHKQSAPSRDPALIKTAGQITAIEYARQIEDVRMASFHHPAWAEDIKLAYPLILQEVVEMIPDLIPQPRLDLDPSKFEALRVWLIDRHNELVDGVGAIGRQLEVIEESEEAGAEKLCLIRDRALGKAEGVAYIAIIGFRLLVHIETDNGTKPLAGKSRSYTLTGNVKLRRYELGPEVPDIVMQELFTYTWKDKGV